MPSLHALDATIVSVVMATVVRRRWAKVLWLAWAPWVWFAVMATGNHFWLDVAAGVLVAAGLAAAIVLPPPWWPRNSATTHAAGMQPEGGVHRRARGAIASRSMTGLARTRVTPNMLTAAGVTLCAVGAVLVYFEYRDELLFFFGAAPSSSARSSTSSTARSPGPAGSRRRSAASSTRRSTASARG